MSVAGKKVRFDEASNSFAEPEHGVEDSKTSWYKHDDLKQISYEVHRTSLATQFKQSSNNPLSYANVMKQVYADCMDGKLPSKKAFKYFVHWHRACPERRGIERYCVRNLASEVRERASNSVILVLALQTQLKLESRESPAERETRIHEAYQEDVKAARVFARLKGIADATVTKTEAPPNQTRGKRKVSSTNFSNTSSHTQHPLQNVQVRLPVKKRKLLNWERDGEEFCTKTSWGTTKSRAPQSQPLVIV